MELRLASYNVHKCVGMDRRRRPDRILEVLSALSADVVVLQETDRRLGPRPTTLPREQTEAATGMSVLPVATGAQSLGWHGQAILVRRDLRLTGLHRVDLPGVEPRGAILAELATPDGGHFRIGALHLGLLRRSRRLQAQMLAALLNEGPPMPTILMGDFNEWSLTTGLGALGKHFDVHAPGPSFPSSRPFAKLDRVVTGQGARLVQSGVHMTDQSRIASDHLPIWARVAIA